MSSRLCQEIEAYCVNKLEIQNSCHNNISWKPAETKIETDRRSAMSREELFI